MEDFYTDLNNNITSAEGIYRAAFPAFRIFIYGQEVSGDVVEVRVNQSGGSQDRAPSTCSFTLVNVNDKYIVNHQDMYALGNSRNTLVNRLKANVEEYKKFTSQIKDTSNNANNQIQEFYNLLNNSSYYEDFRKDLQTYYDNMYVASENFNVYWDQNKVPDLIKLQVLRKKAPQLIPDSEETRRLLEKDYSDVDFYKKSLIYIYPFQEGDCIFHPNDPIRIAFRDPFNPLIWYWQFTGFMDSFTEDKGVNNESTITITGTDVTKTVRYSFIQTDANTLDAGTNDGIKKLFAENPAIQGLTAQTNFVAYQNIFAGFTTFEILELLFFGLESFRTSLTLSSLVTISSMLPDEMDVWLFNSYESLTREDIKKMTPEKKKEKLRKFMIEERSKRFIGAHIPMVTTPRGIPFKRKNNLYGVHAIFIGDELDSSDKVLGEGISVNSLRELNEKLHHRVRPEDLKTMAKDESKVNDRMLAIDDIISLIGTNIEQYPVGYGKVYYVAPAKLGAQISRGILDEAINGQPIKHSEFLDRLTFLYDLADQIEFRCYATPKGDIVFEMPFFDFESWQFDNKDNHISNAKIEESQDLLKERIFESLQKEVENGSKYSDDDILKITGLTYSDEDLLKIASLYSDWEKLKSGVLYNSIIDNSVKNYRYANVFTIEMYETLSFSNSLNDQGLKTVFRSAPNFMARFESFNKIESQRYEYVPAVSIAPILGFRLGTLTPWTGISTIDGARLFATLCLSRANSEARNVGIPALPKFGLMVNRPLYWRARNYMANIVSCQHSIVVNSSCDSTVNLNYVRGWTGSLDPDSKEIYSHFGGELPFNLAKILSNRR